MREIDYANKKWKQFIEQLEDEIEKFDRDDRHKYFEASLKDFVKDVTDHFKSYKR